MIRVLLYSVIAVVFVLGFSWLSVNTGTVEITWLDYHISTTLTFLFLLIFLIYLFFRLIFLPFRFFSFFRIRRELSKEREKQKLLVSVLSATSSGDESKYKVLQKKINSLYNQDDILRSLLLLNITSGEERIELLRDLSTDNATELIGIKGRIDEAIKAGKKSVALELYKQAFDRFPKVEWVSDPLISLTAFFQRWDEVISISDRAYKLGSISKARYLSVKSTALLEKGLSDSDKGLIFEAAKTDKTNSYAQIKASICYANQGDTRKAISILLGIWKQYPSLAIYDNLRLITSSYSSYKRLKLVEKMSDMIKGNPLSDLILAEAYSQSSLWGQAKYSAEKYLHLYPSSFRAKRIIYEAEAIEAPEIGSKRLEALSSEREELKKWQCRDCKARFNEWHSICSSCTNFATVYPDDEKST